MSRRVLSIVLGLILISLAALWFLTPVSGMVMEALGLAPPQATRGPAGAAGAPPASANMEIINIALNALNALFGAFGVLLMLRASRAR